jgi:DnaJ-class molecular chaperone
MAYYCDNCKGVGHYEDGQDCDSCHGDCVEKVEEE